MTDVLLVDHFRPHVGKLFHFKGTPHAIVLDRIETGRAPPPGMPRQPFALVFRGPKARDHLPEGEYECQVENGPSWRMHVNPIYTPQPDRQEYQAVFN